MTELRDAGDGVGAELARAREALGYSIADVARQLKFAPRQIEALEQGRYEDLPTGTFARGMLRAYARLLKIDPAPLVARIAGRVAVPDNVAVVASARRPIPITDSSRRSNLIYAAFSLAVLVLVAGVVFEWQRERSRAARLTFVPAAQAPRPPAQAPRDSGRTAVASSVATPNLTPLPQPDAPGAAQEGLRRIALHFERSAWVEIRGHDGKTLMSQLNPEGAQRVVEGKPPFTLVIGNAQHVRLTYDERPIDLAPHVKVEVARFTLE